MGKHPPSSPRTIWTNAFKSLPRRKVAKPILGNLAAVIGKEVTTFGSTDLESAKVTQPRNVEGHFPMVDEVLPKKQPVCRFRIDAKLFAELLAVASQFSPDGGAGVDIDVFDKDGKVPIMVRAKNDTQEFTGVIMPLAREGK